MSVINPYPMTDAHFSPDARLYPNRETLLLTLPPNRPRVAELGVQYGLNAQYILDALDPEVLYLLDINLTLISDELRNDPRTVLYSGDGADTLDTMLPDSLDWVYVDGHHGFESAYRDGLAAMRVAPIVVFNDYTNYSIIEREEYGVIAAVNRLLNEHIDWEVFGMGLQRDGYHDIAIRRRAW